MNEFDIKSMQTFFKIWMFVEGKLKSAFYYMEILKVDFL